MDRLIFRVTVTVLVLVVMAAMVPSASADGVGVTWTLSGVTFGDGGTASGSFVYDAADNKVISIHITTTKGSAFGGDTYTAVDPGFGPFATSMDFVTLPSLSDYTGLPTVFLSFQSALTDSGGTIALLLEGSSGETPCGNPGCTIAGTQIRAVTGGEVVSSVVPEPSSLLLLGTGLFGLVGAAKLKILQV